MIDEYSLDGTGWARFSDDGAMRYRLGRAVGRVVDPDQARRGWINGNRYRLWQRVVFLMLNPSTADAFKLDPTVTRCLGFARSWGADTLEVVNIFALRSTDPDELYKYASGSRGDDVTNNQEILEACAGAFRVVAGWGVHGKLGSRGEKIRAMLKTSGIELHHLGRTKDGHPKHPLYLKGSTQPELWG